MQRITSIGIVLLLTALTPLVASADNFLTKRAKPPGDFKRFEWPEKRKVLFGLFAPNEEEKRQINEAIPTGVEKPADPPRVMIFYRCNYPHTAIATGVYALDQMGKRTGVFEPTLSDDPADFTPTNLAKYDAVLLLHTTGYEQTIGPVGQAALANYLKQGNGLVGIHAAADACGTWPAGADLMGGVFRGHPWLPKDTWAVRLESPDHPLNAAFGGEGFWHRDEIYIYRPGTFSRERSRVLLSLDMSKEHNRSSKSIPERMMSNVDPAGDYPIAWAHERGGGRVFYSNFGHNVGTFRNAAVLRHYLDGILYATGRLEADVTPSAELGATEYAPAPDRE